MQDLPELPHYVSDCVWCGSGVCDGGTLVSPGALDHDTHLSSHMCLVSMDDNEWTGKRGGGGGGGDKSVNVLSSTCVVVF